MPKSDNHLHYFVEIERNKRVKLLLEPGLVVMADRSALLSVAMAFGVGLSSTSPLTAQSPESTVRAIAAPDGTRVYAVPATPGKAPQARTVILPDGRTVIVVDQRPKDPRTPRERCVDDEIAALGGAPSALAMGTIDLKCSQR
ncbi:hypothetical protein ACQEPB_04005 [Novosphingobium fluoreni]|uniref:hypothetical protein n=1 Tax=Novosphingobium fluoreni TaxID=1391222 RepID=UPI003DA0B2FB